jgi:predicted lactoylglutathione lyase
MIGYLTLGTNDLERAGSFYDELLGELGAERVMTDVRMLGWSTGRDAPVFAVITPFDEEPATVGNGTMIAINVETPENVERLYNKAMEMGCQDEGHPHDRGSSMGFYGGYFRDPDGNKLVFYCLGYQP